ncbi:MAG: response regulator, partial [Bacteroidales bacterium]|nr:response regulator [Bacteroidales bacterium]
MKRAFVILSMAIAMLLCIPSYSQTGHLSVEVLSVQDGLSSPDVYAITQDRDGFIWFGTGRGADRYDGRRIRKYRLSNQVVNCMLVTSSGDLLVGTEKGIDRYDSSTDRFERADIFESVSSDNIRTVVEEVGSFWVGTDRGLFRISSSGQLISHYSSDDSPLPHNIVRTVCIRGDYVFVGTFDGAARLDRKTGEWRVVNLKPSHFALPQNNLVLTMIPSPDEDEILLVGTQTGLCELNMSTMEYVCHDINSNPTMSNNTVKSICVVRDGYWFGSEEGVMVSDRLSVFDSYGHVHNDPHSLPGSNIWSLFLDRSDIVWIGTDNGVAYYDASAPDFDYYDIAGAKGITHPDYAIQSASVSGESDMWLCSRYGLSKYSVPNSGMKDIPLASSFEGTYNMANCVCVDGNELVWVGTAEGLVCYDPVSGRDLRVQARLGTRLKYIISIDRGEDGKLYLSNVRNQIQVVSYEFDSVHRVFTSVGDEVFEAVERTDRVETDRRFLWCITRSNSLLRYHVPDHLSPFRYAVDAHSLYYDRKNEKMWVGTGDALCLYDYVSDTIVPQVETATPVVSIVATEIGFVWFTTSTMLCCYDSVTKSVRMHPLSHWLRNQKCELISDSLNDNIAYLVGREAIVKLDIEKMVINGGTFHSPLCATEMLVNGVDVYESGIVAQPLPGMKKIRLKPSQNSFSLSCAMMDFRAPSLVNYTYRLLGYDKTSRTIPAATPYIEYMSVPPGKYELQVSAQTRDGFKADNTINLKIEIAYHWWQLWWVRLLIATLVVAACAYLLMLRRKHRQVQEELEKEKLEKERAEGVNKLKTKFFANITHDFRTPLTLIISPVESMISEEKDADKLSKLDIVRQNAYRLLRLVNQILDFKKVENKQVELNLTNGDLVAILRGVCDTFKEMSHKKNVSLLFETTEDRLNMDFDADAMDKIMVNLIANAIKFTPEGGHVLVSLNRRQEDSVEVSVTDTGVGIPEDDIPRIFERFYQVGESHERETKGTGLGLSIVKELVDLHGGEISVSSDSNGTTFKFSVPIRNEVKKTDADAGTHADDSAANRILLVEDNKEMRDYLAKEISAKHRVKAVESAEAALDVMARELPDMVVSDVMLGGMSGVDLCRKIKSEESLNHIPVLLLSALTDESSVISGFDAGADEYIGKPFNIRVLLSRIDNIVSQHVQLREGLKRDTIDLPSTDRESPDVLFLRKVVSLVNDNIADPELDIPFLCDKLAMSHISFYRKMKAITGYNINTFIREIRLKKAAQLLRVKGYNVSEVMYEVGFNHRSYFSSCFKEL